MSLMNRIRWTRKNRSFSSRIRAAAPRTKLLVAALEDRTVPATITVTNSLDDTNTGNGVSLREAILSINAGSDLNSDVTAGKTGAAYAVNDTILFSGVSGTLTMTGGEFALMKSMTITGPGAGMLTIDAAHLSRHFNVSDDTAAQIKVSMSGLTLINGQAPDPTATVSGNGGSIFSRNEILSLDGMVITGNKTSSVVGVGRPSGGAISMGDAPVPGNSSGLGGTLNINNCEIDNNYSANVGGGIGFQFPNNLAGGVGNVFTITNSTVASNTAALRGGGIYFSGNAGGQLNSSFSMRNTTVSSNKSLNAFGGGVLIASTTKLPMSILNSTITNNSAMTTPGGGGLALNTGTGTLTLQSSIISDNFGPASAPEIFTNSNVIINSTNNIIGSKVGIANQGYFSDLGGTIISSAKLGPLTNNGTGITLTHMPAYNSPAINPAAGSSSMTQTTLGPAIGAADTSVFVVNTTGIAPGNRFGIESEVVKVSQVGTAVATTLAAPIGSSTATFALVNSTANLSTGMNLNIDNETVAVSSIPTVSTTLAAAITSTTLTADITTPTATSCTVASTTGITLNGFILVDSEYMKVTNISSLTLTVSRGQNGSVAATHSNGATVNVATCTVASATNIAVNQLLLIDSELVQVFATSSTTLTLRRGANGTTVATHANGAGVFNNSLTSATALSAAITSTTLSAAISSTTATQITVASATGIFVNQLLLIDSEYVQVQGIVGTTLIVARGANSSTAATHSSGAAVNAVTCTVNNTAGIVNNQLLLIDAEYVQVTNISGTTLTVTRAQNGTVAAAHSSGATVFLPLSGPAISSTANFCTVTSTAGISVGMLMLIDSEYVLVTGVGSGPPTLAIQRGVNGTTAAAHSLRAALSTVTVSISRGQFGTTAVGHSSGASVFAPSLTISRGENSTTAAAHAGAKPLLIAYDQLGNARTQGATIDIGAVEVNTAAPTAIASNIVTTAGAATGSFSVTYTSTLAGGINVVGTVVGNNSAVRVVYPNGTSVPATYVSIDNGANGSPRTASYTFAAPGGSFDFTENGTYSIVVQANQVFDTAAVPVAVPNVAVGRFNLSLGRSLVVVDTSDLAVATTVINNPILNTDTTFDVNDTTNIVANQYLLLDAGTTSAEYVQVMGVVGNTLTVTRGQLGTTAVGHSLGASVVLSTLRWAINQANANTFATDSVTFNTSAMGSSSITLSAALPVITDPISIDGGAGVTIDGASTYRVFEANGPGNMAVSMSNLTIANGKVPGTQGDPNIGGGVLAWDEKLTLTNCKITGTVSGGAVAMYAVIDWGALTIGGCTIDSNMGGGVIAGSSPFGPGPDVSIQNSSITNNTGSGISGRSFSFNMANSTIAGNSGATTGGGINIVGNWDSNGNSIINSTITGNSAANSGGGIYMYWAANASQRVLIANTTIVGNFTNGGFQNKPGGGVNNHASSTSNAYQVDFENCVIASNTNSTVPDFASGKPVIANNSLIGIYQPTSGTVVGYNNKLGSKASPIDPEIRPLQSNGGPTQTMLPYAGSPLVDVTPVVSTLANSNLVLPMSAAGGAVVLNNAGFAKGAYVGIDSETMQVSATSNATQTQLASAVTAGATSANVVNNGILAAGENILVDSEWMQVSAVAGASLTTLTGPLTTSATTITVANPAALAIGQILLIDTEFVRVTAVTPSITIVRAQLSSTAIAHNSGATLSPQLVTPITTLSKALATTSATTAFVASTANLTVGMNLLVDAEFVKVTAINNFSTTLTAPIATTTATICTLASTVGIPVGSQVLIDNEYVTISTINNIATTLTDAAGINATTNTLNVASAAGMSNGTILQIDNEYVTVAAINGTTLLVVRGSLGSTAAAHSNGAAVTNSATITRGAGGSTAATHLSGAAVANMISITRGQLGTTAAAHNTTGVNMSSPYINVLRGQQGTTAAAHSALANMLAPAVSFTRGVLGTTAAAHVSGTFFVAYTQPANDQRGSGNPRALNGKVDIGAVETDPNIPSAVLTAPIPNIVAATPNPVTFMVTFADDVAISVATITGANANSVILVTGPNGYNVLATYVPNSISVNSDGTPRTASYTVSAPGAGGWTVADNGVYTIAVASPSVVTDTSNNFVEVHAIGTFQVALTLHLVVTNANDFGPGSLRDAINQANANAGVADLITFDPTFFSTPQTITLASGDLFITDPLTINGPGAGLVTLQGAGYRIFTIDTPSTQQAITLSGMTMTGGDGASSVTVGVVSGGGAIFNQDEAVTINNCVITKNDNSGATDFTGAITTNTYGGGILLGNALATLTLENSTVSNNSTGVNGGGIAVRYGCAVNIDSCTISGNSAGISGSGGGISAQLGVSSGTTPTPTITLTNSSIINNVAASGAGVQMGNGVSNSRFAVFTAVNDTFSGNIANGTSSGTGGAISMGTSINFTIQNCTISGNYALISGGGLQLGGSAGINSIYGAVNGAVINTIIAGNFNRTAPDVGGGNSTTGFSMSFVNSIVGAVNQSITKINNVNSQIGTLASPINPFLSPLTTNGGLTLTQIPLPGSPAINAGTAAPVVTLTTLNATTGSMDNVQTTMAVTAIAAILANTYIQIDSEIMFVVSATSTTVTVTRGQQSTTAAPHSAGAPIIRSSFLAPPTNDQRGSGYPRQLDGTIDIGAVEVDPTIPYASGAFAKVTTAGATTQTLTVTYTDAGGNLNLASITSSDLLVTGPNGFSTTATFVSANPGTGGDVTETVTYSFTPPVNSAAGWDASDNGFYSVNTDVNHLVTNGTNPVFVAQINTLQVAIARTFVVDTTDDVDDGNYTPGHLSIREALNLANASVGTVDHIIFDPTVFATPQVIALNAVDGGELTITDPVIITGPGMANLTIDAQMQSRVLTISMTPAYWGSAVSISGMTFINGRNLPLIPNGSNPPIQATGFAAGITDFTAALTLDSCELYGNSISGAAGGIGLSTLWAGLTLTNSSLHDNTAGTGAGVYIGNNGSGLSTVPNTVPVTIQNTTFDSNVAAQGGGLAALSGANVQVTNCTFTNNVVNQGFTSAGGAVYISGANFTLQNSTVSNNSSTGSSLTATGNGGGLYFTGSTSTITTATLTNDTISGNTAAATTTGGSGGGIFISGQSNVTINGGSIINNAIGNATSTTAGGGGVFLSGAATVTINNAIIANNTAISIGGGILASSLTTAALPTGSGTLIINGSTISGNVTTSSLANTGGGGLFVNGTGGMTLITNSTISGNSSGLLGGGILAGGATVMAGNLSIRNSTIAYNTATSGGGIDFNTTSGTVTTTLNLLSSIVSNNSAPTGADILTNSTLARINVGPDNTTLFGTAAAGNGTIFGTPLVSAGANLGALANNGGPTQTHALGVGSTAINAGTAATDVLATTSAAMAATDATFSVANLAALAPFGIGQRIKIDNEVMTISGMDTVGFTVTVNRAQDGTVAAAHNSGVNVSFSSLLGNFDQRGKNRSNGITDIGAFESNGFKVTSVVINDGSVQRSMITQLKVNFDQHVTFSGPAAAAFTLNRVSDNAAVNLAAAVDDSGAFTVVTLTFTGGAAVDPANSLADGRYAFHALASSFGGDGLDGNGDGVSGDDFIYDEAAQPAPLDLGKIFRFFGDVTGDGAVSAFDFNGTNASQTPPNVIGFKQAFGGVNFAFDYNGDGAVAASDFIQFRQRFGGSI
jgi:hypothetical protein